MSLPQPHEAKPMPRPTDPSIVVSAYGHLANPKLISQISQTSNFPLRKNALNVLCDELRNPYSAGGCVRSGVVEVLNALVNEPSTSDESSSSTRELATRALSALSIDSNGRTTMIAGKTAQALLVTLEDPDSKVRENCYECLLNLTEVQSGCVEVVKYNYPALLVDKSKNEIDAIRHLPLRLLYNVIKTSEGLISALDSSAVEVCILNLSSESDEIQASASRTLGFLCFDDTAKITAIKGDAVVQLSSLLDSDNTNVRASAAQALMAISQTDSGKRSLVPSGVIPKLIKLLKDDSLEVLIPVLSIISNASVNPEARVIMRGDGGCLPVISGFLEGTENEQLKRWAGVAREAVLWMP